MAERDATPSPFLKRCSLGSNSTSPRQGCPLIARSFSRREAGVSSHRSCCRHDPFAHRRCRAHDAPLGESSPSTGLAAGLPPVEVVVVLIAPIGDCARALHLIGRLMACLAESGIVARAGAAATREALVDALAPAERVAGVFYWALPTCSACSGRAPPWVSDAEAARRRLACGPNRLERVARRPLAMRLLAQFTSLFACSGGGALAFLAGLAEGWAGPCSW